MEIAIAHYYNFSATFRTLTGPLWIIRLIYLFKIKINKKFKFWKKILLPTLFEVVN